MARRKALNWYRIFDLLLKSNFPLPELPAVTAAQEDIRVELLATAMPAESSPQWIHHWRDPDGETTLSLAQAGQHFILRSPGLADFRIAPDGKRIEISAVPATPVESIRHLLIDQVLPRVVAQGGRTVLHASAVGMDQAVILFVGDSGAGKSTLATWFYQNGYRLLADDCLVLAAGPDGAGIIPSYSGARLWDDSPVLGQVSATDLFPVAHYSDKLRLHLAHSEPLQTPHLTTVLVLAPPDPANDEACALIPLSGAAAVMALVRHSFQLDITDSQRSSAQFRTLGELVDKGLPILQLTYPHKPEALATILEQVNSLVSGPGHESCTRP